MLFLQIGVGLAALILMFVIVYKTSGFFVPIALFAITFVLVGILLVVGKSDWAIAIGVGSVLGILAGLIF
jgi:hypothetical protein